MQNEKMIEKIQALMSKTVEAGATEAEAESAMGAAHRLLAKYNLTMQEVQSHDKEGMTTDVYESSWNQPWERMVWNSVAKLYFCHMFIVPNGQKACKVHITGRAANIMVVDNIANYVINTGKRLAREFAQATPGNSVSLSNNFKKGFAFKIADRVEEMIKDAESQGMQETGTALVLASLYQSERDAARDHLAKDGIRLAKGTTRSRITDLSALGQGKSAAKNVNLRANGVDNNKSSVKMMPRGSRMS